MLWRRGAILSSACCRELVEWTSTGRLSKGSVLVYVVAILTR